MENAQSFSSKLVDNSLRQNIHIDRLKFLVQLASQQSNYITRHTDLNVGMFHGELGVDNWDKSQWDNELEKYQVLVFTAQVFLNIVDHNIFCKRSILLRKKSIRVHFSDE